MCRRVGLGKRLCGEVIDHQQALEARLGQQPRLAELPVVVGHIDLGRLHRAGNGNAGSFGCDTGPGQIGGKCRGK